MGSFKQLWHLVTEQGLITGDQVLELELGQHLDALSQGLSHYKPGSPESRAAYGKKRSGKLTSFICDLSTMIQVEEEQSKAILMIYLAGTFLRENKMSQNKIVLSNKNVIS